MFANFPLWAWLAFATLDLPRYRTVNIPSQKKLDLANLLLALPSPSRFTPLLSKELPALSEHPWRHRGRIVAESSATETPAGANLTSASLKNFFSTAVDDSEEEQKEEEEEKEEDETAEEEGTMQELQVLNTTVDGLIGLDMKIGGKIYPGTLLDLGNGGKGIVYAERANVYFAALTSGDMPKIGDRVLSLGINMTTPLVAVDDSEWAGLHNYLGVPVDASVPEDAVHVQVLKDPVPVLDRKAILKPLHTGIPFVDILTPIGRGQSMMLWGPESLPPGYSRTDFALTLIENQYRFESDIKCVLVLIGSDEKRAQSMASLKESGAIKKTKVLQASTAAEALIAAHVACSFSEQDDGDTLVVIDDLQGHLRAWQFTEQVLKSLGLEFSPDAAGSQLRLFFSPITERTHSHNSGKTVSMVFVQESLGKGTENTKESYTLDDFATYTEAVKSRIGILEKAGVAITPERLNQVGIPLPGSVHRATGSDSMLTQHLEELTSLVDGHWELSESLASAGYMPPVDLTNSLTRIGAGTTAMRSQPTPDAMKEFSYGLRFKLCENQDRKKYTRESDPLLDTYEALLSYPLSTPLTLGEDIALLVAARHGLLTETVKEMGVTNAHSAFPGFLAAINEADGKLLGEISASGFLPKEVGKKIVEIGSAHFKVEPIGMEVLATS